MQHDTKVCCKCGEEKDITKFHRDKNSGDGRRSDCAECNKQASKASKARKKAALAPPVPAPAAAPAAPAAPAPPPLALALRVPMSAFVDAMATPGGEDSKVSISVSKRELVQALVVGSGGAAAGAAAPTAPPALRGIPAPRGLHIRFHD